MAIFRLSIQVISRSKGRSAVAAAAYRAGERIENERIGVIHDYTRKRGIVHTEIMLPVNAPSEYADRATLWNAVEKIEKASNSQLAREVVLSLPVELTMEQNITLAQKFVKRHFVEQGMCADVCVHNNDKGNPHAHVLLTLRPFSEPGIWGDKQRKEYILDGNGDKIYDKKKKTYKCKSVPTTDWNEHERAEEWRSAWSDALNAALEKHGHTARVDHRSYERQGIEQFPTVRIGVAATQMERRGILTERGNINRAIAVTNNELRQLRARITKVKDWLYSVPIANAPTMIDMMNGVANGEKLKSHWKRIADLKVRAKVLVFLTSNNITDVEQLAAIVERMHRRQYDVANRIKAIDRRKDKLAEHLAQVDARKLHMAVYKKYKGLDPKKRGAYLQKHADEIERYESAAKYLKDHLNGYGKIPERDWRAEQDKLTAERYGLCEEYYKLRDDVKSVEALRRNAEILMLESVSDREQMRKQDISL